MVPKVHRIALNTDMVIIVQRSKSCVALWEEPTKAATSVNTYSDPSLENASLGTNDQTTD
jgi:hypothetical protein